MSLLFRRICLGAAAAKTPVVLLKNPGPREPGSWQGPEGTITLEKPVRQSRLLETIQALVRAGRVQQTDETCVLEAPTPSLVAARQIRVLLVDDNRINQVVGTRLLQREGHSVTVVGSGEEALATLMREVFDVRLMDVQMPGMDGLETTAALRQQERGTGHRVHVIALTAHAMKGDRERCLEAGMDGYLSKPVNPAELRKALAGLTHNTPVSSESAAMPAGRNGDRN